MSELSPSLLDRRHISVDTEGACCRRTWSEKFKIDDIRERYCASRIAFTHYLPQPHQTISSRSFIYLLYADLLYC